MIDLFKANYNGIMKAFWETNYMMIYSMLTVFFISLPLGIMLFAFSRDYLLKNRAVYEGLSISLNALRSVPFLIFVFILIPVNRFLLKHHWEYCSNLASYACRCKYLCSICWTALINVPKKIVDKSYKVWGLQKFKLSGISYYQQQWIT